MCSPLTLDGGSYGDEEESEDGSEEDRGGWRVDETHPSGGMTAAKKTAKKKPAAKK